MTRSPTVSIIMNCFNGETYLRDAVDSVLAQTFEDWELIFWDNQSTDGSAEIFKSYKDPRLHYWYASDHTLLYEARNHGIERARGEYIAMLDTDDWWLPEKLEKQLPLFADPEVGFTCSNFWITSMLKNKTWQGINRSIATGWVLQELLRYYWVALVTLMVRRSALESLDYPCDPRYQIIGDFDLVIRLAENWKFDYLDEPVAFSREHWSNEMRKDPSRHLHEMAVWLEEAKVREPVSLSPSLRHVEWNLTYSRAMYQIFRGEWRVARRLFVELPWGRKKLRLLVALLLPSLVGRRARPRDGHHRIGRRRLYGRKTESTPETR